MMMRPKIFILFVFYILSNLQFLLHGSDFYFRNISVEDGLSQNMVYSIFQDKTGFIWFVSSIYKDSTGKTRMNGLIIQPLRIARMKQVETSFVC
ncbi:MAG: hypothetical protein EOM62_01890 [Bacteroidia bacterium]|nr:hypothetical protein [Bacteroidia bacterium]